MNKQPRPTLSIIHHDVYQTDQVLWTKIIDLMYRHGHKAILVTWGPQWEASPPCPIYKIRGTLAEFLTAMKEDADVLIAPVTP